MLMATGLPADKDLFAASVGAEPAMPSPCTHREEAWERGRGIDKWIDG